MAYKMDNLSFDVLPKWWALFVRVNHEKQVAHHLEHRGVEHFLPLYQSVRNWKDRQVRRQCPLFPGYVFIKLLSFERMKALTVPNVISIVGTNGQPSVISEEELTWVRRGIEFGGIESHPQVTTGTRVAITSGSLAGMEGIFLPQQNKQNKARILIAVNSISRAFVVEVEHDSIEPVSPVMGHLETSERGLEIAS
jgi:transcriptional antiterminator NusG